MQQRCTWDILANPVTESESWSRKTLCHYGDVECRYRYGVNEYLLKPMHFVRLQQMVQQFVAYWFEAALLPTHLEGM
jgi:hypothetical protein